ncbi:hypothetical protein WJX72_007714 [[Myrmecia] bisecta]|uniref:Uncharacterized protein n=1 Tax=[Myrmecia] bisecta TaxID=41462 RepID=A0AAW1P3G0_9CHLO
MVALADANYNKAEHRGTLVGNWNEEKALLKATGIHRYKPWVDPHAQEETVFTHRQDHPESISTFDRVFRHTDQLQAKDWTTHQRACFQSPSQRADPARYTSPPAIGKRAQLELTQLMSIASTQPVPEPLPPQFETQTHADFVAPDMSDIQVGARVMKTQDGLPVKRDPVFLAEQKIMDKNLADRLLHGAAESDAREPESTANPDVPISIYSEARKCRGKAAPFGKQTNFSKPMSDHTKVVIDE